MFKMYYAIKVSDKAWLDENHLITKDYNNAYITRSEADLKPITDRLNVSFTDYYCQIVNVTERELRID